MRYIDKSVSGREGRERRLRATVAKRRGCPVRWNGSAAPFSLPDYPPRIKMTRGARRIVTITRIVLPAPRRMLEYPARGN